MGTAGVVFDVSEITKIDLNYRYVYIGRVRADIHEHQLGAGIRWDIN